MSENQTTKGLLFIISGPAGSGKTTICEGLIAKENVHRIITTTTRSPRSGEVNGVDYNFLSKTLFEKMIEKDYFYEYAHVHNNHYGTEKKSIIDPIMNGHNCILNIDVQGARTIREKAETDIVLKDQVKTIFIMPPSVEALKLRMSSRGKDSEQEINRRLIVAEEEIQQIKFYDYVIKSTTKQKDLNAMCTIFYKETR